MSPFRLARLELRRYRGHPVRAAVVAAIVLLPAVCAGLYLWSFWDPYGSTDEMPVALVNEDAGTTLDRGGEFVEVNGGEQVVERLREAPVFDWRVTDADEARAGLADGDYSMVVTIPENFSAAIAGLAVGEPVRAAVEFERDDANGYLAGVMTATVERELQHQIDSAVYDAFAGTLFGGLTGGLGQAVDGAATLHTGLSGLSAAAEDAAAGAEQVATGLDEAVGESAPAVESLAEDWEQVQTGSAAGADVVADAARLSGAYSALCRGGGADGFACETLWEHVQLAESVSTDVQSADAAVQATPAEALETAAEDLGTLQTDAAGVADAAGQVATGVADAETTAGDLAGGLGELYDGADAVVSGLTDARADVPAANGAADEAAEAESYGSPVAISEETHNPAGSYGRGLAPLVIATVLWGFGIVAYLLLRPVNARALAGPLRSPLVALGGWLAGAALGVVSALALYLVIDVGLGLDPRQVPATAGLCVLVVLTFSAMAHLFRLALGAMGILLLAVLLMLQMAAAGGLYPVETTPAFFQAIHPWLPMTYAVDALRVTISGGQTEHLVRALVVLVLYLAASLAVAAATVAMRRKWTTGRLHPPLSL
ncbi:YhgE/Pip family protein [Glycomyces arizonensis]|uniref:YhgE/Pip family protein n=1 Tax=Glycomyces arizonensis TaxID=256035 RepID=UPI000413D8EF|nr:YhgE/Pip family protein [Glycomyces arizonensis]